MKLFLVAALAAVSAWSQAARTMGALESIDAAAKKIVVKTDAGESATLDLADSTAYVRIKPGARDLTGAEPLKVADLAVGDRVLVQGNPATRVIVMSKGDIATKQAADKAMWDKRGVMGTVTAVNAAEQTVTVGVRSGMPGTPAKPMTISTNSRTVVRRYAPDSIKFSEAQPSTLAEIRVGDQVRALGDKNAEGTAMSAEELVSGTFKNIAATILSIDEAAGTLTVTDLDAKKPVLVHFRPDSSAKRMPEMMARMMAFMLNAGSGGAGGAGAPGMAMRPGGGAGGPGGGMRQGGGAGGPGGMMMGGGGPPNPAQMLERLPPIKLADLKVGDALIISSTAGKKDGELTAITVLAGVEPILTSPSRNGSTIGGWNLDMGGGMGMTP
ncbi:MAG: DUF5666 domain-containing protein [Bryobacteraceae bacterium]|nr:DUF5666 domain-containing protein [Bryobacteraceae bacterium]